MTLPRREVRDDALTRRFAALRERLDVPAAFPPEVEAAADAAAVRGPRGERIDATHLPFTTIDPPGSMDLDQALHVAADGRGLVARYAIADVAAFVDPGDPVDVEAWVRGVTRYSPDTATPLHPRALSEGAASLLPGEDRPAVLWTMRLDGQGELVDTAVERAVVRSRSRQTYAEAQRAIEVGDDQVLVELSRLGRLRAEREWVRGGVSLDLPDQEVHRDGAGRWELRYRAPLPVEGWNAQLSLLCGQAAAQLMLDAGVGVLRTLPTPDPETIEALRRRGHALGLPWPAEVGYPDFVRTLDPHEPAEAAMISLAAVGLRGAGYVAFDTGSGHPVPEAHRHSGVAAAYAHVTAPLRRLVDRYAAEVALAVHAGRPVPSWVTERLGALPRAMASARGRAGALDRAVLDLVEAHVLADRVGEALAATVVRVGEGWSDVQLRRPAVLARIVTALPLGTEVHVRVADVDVEEGRVSYELVEVDPPSTGW